MESAYRQVSWQRQALVILVLCWLAQIISLGGNPNPPDLPLWQLMLQSSVFILLVTIPPTVIGLLLGPKIGLGAPLLANWLGGASGSTKQFLQHARWALITGALLGAVILLIDAQIRDQLPPEVKEYGFRGVTGGVLVSIGAGVAEEVWFRLGLMTLLCFAVVKLAGKQTVTPLIGWSVIIVTGVAFGAAHLPSLISYGVTSPVMMLATIAGNTLVGLLYGYAYWRRGLLCAMLAHIFLDIVLHALPALW